MGKQLKFYYVVSERISEDEFKAHFSNELVGAQRKVTEVCSAELPTYLGVLWNSVTLSLSLLPAFDLANPNMHTLSRVVKRRLEDSLLSSRFTADVRVKLDQLYWEFMHFLAFRPGEARRLFHVETRGFCNLASGKVGASSTVTTVRQHIDTTLVTLCPGQTEKFVKQSKTAKEFGFSVREITCDPSWPITARLRGSIARAKGQVQAPRKLSPGWTPPTQQRHYAEAATSSVHAISAGQFESKRGKF